MKQPKLIDYILLTILALIWASAFFNIKIATYSFGPVTIAFLRVFFGAFPVLFLCYVKKIKIEAFSKDWHWFAMIGFINLVAPFFLIAYGVKSVQSNLAAILMSTTPLSSTVLGHLYTKNEKFNLIKTIGILIGFFGIIFLFSVTVSFSILFFLIFSGGTYVSLFLDLLELDFSPFTIPSKAPTSTVSPSLTSIEDKVPPRGDGTSTLTLSVSNSTNGSSDSTVSPTCLSHLETVASVTDSPNDGTKI